MGSGRRWAIWCSVILPLATGTSASCDGTISAPRQSERATTQRGELSETALTQRVALDRDLRALEVAWYQARESQHTLLVHSNIAEGPSAQFLEANTLLTALTATLDQKYTQLSEIDYRQLKALSAESDERQLASVVYSTFLSRLRYDLGPSLEQWQAWAPRSTIRGLRPLPGGCRDPIRDELVASLLLALEGGNGAAYSASLARISSSLDCFAIDDVEAFGSALVESIDATTMALPASAQPAGRRVLLNALLNLIVIVYDESKLLGQSSLRDWMLANNKAMKELSAWPTSVVRQTGLWLKDGRRNGVVQVRDFCEAYEAAGISTDICVSLGHVLEVSVHPWRLGSGTCLLSEMITPQFAPQVGYLCQRELCGISTTPGASQTLLSRLAANSKSTQFGIDVASLQAATCGQASREGGWDVHGGGKPGVGGSLPPARLGCVVRDTGASATEAQRFACVGSVVEKTKTTSSNRASRGGVGCDPTAAGAGDSGVLTNQRPTFSATQESFARQADSFAKFNLKPVKDEWISALATYGWTVSSEQFDSAVASIGNETYLSSSDYKAATSGSSCASDFACTIPDGKGGFMVVVDASKTTPGQMSPGTLGDALAHEAIHLATLTKTNELKGKNPADQHAVWGPLQRCSPGAAAGCQPPPTCSGPQCSSPAAGGSAGGGTGGSTGGGAGTGGGGAGMGGGTGSGGGTGGGTGGGSGKKGSTLCAAGMMNCGNCSPAEAIGSALASCFSPATLSESTELRPGCDETVCDSAPSESPDDVRWAECFDSSAPNDGDSLRCPGMRCPQERKPQIVGGVCSCGEIGSSAPPNPCAYTRCADDATAVPTGSICRCVTSEGDALGAASGVFPVPGQVLPW